MKLNILLFGTLTNKEDLGNGVVSYTYNDGYTYTIYVNLNDTDTTANVVTYIPGQSGDSGQTFSGVMSSDTPIHGIVINGWSTSSNPYNVIDDVCNQLNVDTGKIVGCGHSAGGSSTISRSGSYLASHEDADITYVLLDPMTTDWYCAGYQDMGQRTVDKYFNSWENNNSEALDTIKSEQLKVIFVPTTKWHNFTDYASERLEEYGIDTTVVEASSNNHGDIPKGVISTNLIQMILGEDVEFNSNGFLTDGSESLEDLFENYEPVKITDSAGNTIIKSNINTLLDYTSSISASAQLLDTANSYKYDMQGSSNTVVPSGYASVFNAISDVNNALSAKIDMEMESLLSYAGSIEYLNKVYENQAANLQYLDSITNDFFNNQVSSTNQDYYNIDQYDFLGVSTNASNWNLSITDLENAQINVSKFFTSQEAGIEALKNNVTSLIDNSASTLVGAGYDAFRNRMQSVYMKALNLCSTELTDIQNELSGQLKEIIDFMNEEPAITGASQERYDILDKEINDLEKEITTLRDEADDMVDEYNTYTATDGVTTITTVNQVHKYDDWQAKLTLADKKEEEKTKKQNEKDKIDELEEKLNSLSLKISETMGNFFNEYANIVGNIVPSGSFSFDSDSNKVSYQSLTSDYIDERIESNKLDITTVPNEIIEQEEQAISQEDATLQNSQQIQNEIEQYQESENDDTDSAEIENSVSFDETTEENEKAKTQLEEQPEEPKTQPEELKTQPNVQKQDKEKIKNDDSRQNIEDKVQGENNTQLQEENSITQTNNYQEISLKVKTYLEKLSDDLSKEDREEIINYLNQIKEQYGNNDEYKEIIKLIDETLNPA